MIQCNLTGEIPHSLSKLQSLSSITLDSNNFSAPVPEFIAGFRNLTKLSLRNCELVGKFPEKIFEVPTLTTLQVSRNENLQGTLPQSISKRLVTIDISYCNFYGTIPSSMGALDQLKYLDLSSNNFSGAIPSFSSAKNLYRFELSYNSFTGSIPRLPPMLKYLGLCNNNLEGTMPNFIFEMSTLEGLDLSWNRFNGTLKLHQILDRLENIQALDLSHNLWSIDTNGTSANSSFPLLLSLGLASCNLRVLPEFIKNQPYLYILDLSNNHIQGKVPTWVWKDGLYSLNLSSNSLIGLQQPLPPISSSCVLDLHSNSFTSIDPDIVSSFASLIFLSLSRNSIHGSIPTLLCNAEILMILNLESNYLSGTIPHCLIAKETLVVLNLRGNKLHGAIPDKFGNNCPLETLNLNANSLQGKLPRSVANCKELKVLDLGNNKLNDTFPCHLKNLSNLQVLVLRSNKLHGTVVCSESDSWPLLQIVDLASNHFNGHLSTLLFGEWRVMMAKANKKQSKPNYLRYFGIYPYLYYQDQVSVTFKGLEFVLPKILTIFTSIDLSNNAFHGQIPREVGNLVALTVLNLSYNSLLGNIPPSIGNLTQLESLDLSHNALTGHIPQQLANLNFLEYLNLSFNRLSGKIPTGTQLQSFDISSYEGNQGLYGPPLTLSRGSTHDPGLAKSPVGSHYGSSDSELEWMLRGAEVGFPIGIVVFIGPILCIKRWRQWYCYQVDKLIMKFLYGQNCKRVERRRKRANKKQRQRN